MPRKRHRCEYEAEEDEGGIKSLGGQSNPVIIILWLEKRRPASCQRTDTANDRLISDRKTLWA
jgi:hypothetical protein